MDSDHLVKLDNTMRYCLLDDLDGAETFDRKEFAWLHNFIFPAIGFASDSRKLRIATLIDEELGELDDETVLGICSDLRRLMPLLPENRELLENSVGVFFRDDYEMAEWLGIVWDALLRHKSR